MSSASRSLNGSIRLAAFSAALLFLVASAASAREETLRWRHADPGSVLSFEAHVASTPGADEGATQVISLGVPNPVNGIYRATINVADNDDVYVRLRAVGSDSDPSPLSAEQMRPGIAPGEQVTAGTTITPNPDSSARYSFNSDPVGIAPAGWIDTGANHSLVRDDTLFAVTSLNGDRALSTGSYATDIHSHRELTGAPYTLLTYTGRMATDRANAEIGVTALSQYPLSNVYYRLGTGDNGRFVISSQPGMTCGNPDTGVTATPGVWYRFEFEIDESGGATQIEARVWPENGTRPGTAQASCLDSSPNRSAAGTIGVWASGTGYKYWDDLEVVVPDGAPGSGNNEPPAPPVLLQIIPVAN